MLSNLTSSLSFAQGLGLFAFFVGISAFLQRQDHQFRTRLTLYSGFIAIHFWLMGAPAASTSCIISAIRTWVSGRSPRRRWMWLFIVMVWVIGLPQVHHPMQALALVGTTVGTWGLFTLHGLRLRLCMLSGTVIWFTHNLWLGSIGGSLLEGSFLVTNSVTIFRLYRQQQLAAQAPST